MAVRAMARQAWRTALGLLLALALGGCSLVELGYHQLDWILLQRVEALVYLEADQRARLQQDIDALLDWHCRTELPRYVTLMRDIRRDFQRGDITRASVERYSARIEDRWYALLKQGSGATARLLASLSDRQLAELDAALAERNREMAREVRTAAARDSSRGYARAAERHWTRVLGRLTPEQDDAIAAWARDFEPLGQAGVDYRERLHHRLQRLLREHRGDPNGLERALDTFIGDLRNAPPPDYAARVDANKRRSLDMVTAVANSATPEQVRHLSRRLEGWSRELGDIDCG